MTNIAPIIVVGDGSQSGTYVLRLFVEVDLQLQFGRFQNGQAVFVPRGEALYVGSAMSQHGSTSLARRLLRHATRTDPSTPQGLRPTMSESFRALGLGPPDLEPPARKRPWWHIDFLLEDTNVALAQVFVLRSPKALEIEIADMLVNDAATAVLAPGLGAQDRDGTSHLLRVRAAEDWWARLPTRLEEMGPHGSATMQGKAAYSRL